MKELIRIIMLVLAMILTGKMDVQEPVIVEPEPVVLDSPLPTPGPTLSVIYITVGPPSAPPLVSPLPTPPFTATIGSVEEVIAPPPIAPFIPEPVIVVPPYSEGK